MINIFVFRCKHNTCDYSPFVDLNIRKALVLPFEEMRFARSSLLRNEDGTPLMYLMKQQLGGPDSQYCFLIAV